MGKALEEYADKIRQVISNQSPVSYEEMLRQYQIAQNWPETDSTKSESLRPNYCSERLREADD